MNKSYFFTLDQVRDVLFDSIQDLIKEDFNIGPAENRKFDTKIILDINVDDEDADFTLEVRDEQL